MFRHDYFRLTGVSLVVGVLLTFCALTSSALGYDLTVRVENAIVPSGASSSQLTVYVTNPIDSVAAFKVWLQLDRPDLIRFDSIIDVNGSVTSNFAMRQVRSLSGIWTDALIIGVGQTLPSSPGVRGFGPDGAERRLLRIAYHALSIPDTMTDRTVQVRINPNVDQFNFARPDGSLIGVTGTPPILDPSVVSIVNGQVTVSTNCHRSAADFDFDGDGVYLTVSDYVTLVRYLMSPDSFPQIDPYAADFNGDCFIDYGDAAALDSLFKYGMPICDPGPCFSCRCPHLPVPRCCYGMRGNLNHDPNNVVDLGDLSSLVAYLAGGNTAAVVCLEAANVNGVGIVDLGDLSYLVAYLTGGGAKPPSCP